MEKGFFCPGPVLALDTMASVLASAKSLDNTSTFQRVLKLNSLNHGHHYTIIRYI